MAGSPSALQAPLRRRAFPRACGPCACAGGDCLSPRPFRDGGHELRPCDLAHLLHKPLRLCPPRRPVRHDRGEVRWNVDVPEPPRRAVRQLVARRVPAVRPVERPFDHPALREQALEPARHLPVGSRHSSFFYHRYHIIETFLAKVKGESQKKLKYFLSRVAPSGGPTRLRQAPCRALPARKINHL